MPETPDRPTRPPRPKHDAAYKSLFARRRTVEDTLRALPLATAVDDAGKRDPELEDLVRRLDLSTLERMPTDFVTEHLGRRHADMVWRISQVLVMRHGPEGRTLEIRIRKQEEARMSVLIERARRWGEELNQEWLERGMVKGIARGIEKGREEGRLEGEREMVRRLVARRFGEGAAEDFVPVLAGVSDSDRLAAIAAEVFACETAAELVERARGGGSGARSSAGARTAS